MKVDEIILSPRAYRTRTGPLQAVVDGALAIAPFAKTSRVPGIPAILRSASAYLGSSRTTAQNVEIIVGELSALAEAWPTRQRWRDRVGEEMSATFNRCSLPDVADRLQPPIWRSPRLPNVFDMTFVATRERADELRSAAHSQVEFDTGWEALCFVEQIIDATLVTELISDRYDGQRASWVALFDLCRQNVIPVGPTHSGFAVFVSAAVVSAAESEGQ